MHKFGIRLLTLGALVSASSCITMGHPLPLSKLDAFKRCESTEADILASMGEPYERGRSLTYTTLRYVHVKAHLLGTKPKREDLLFYINKQGVMVDFVLNPIAQVMALPDVCQPVTHAPVNPS